MNSIIPFFSVCIPNFNYGSYIGQTIQSVLNQEFSNFEIIICDNASTDDSWSVIQSFAQKDSRLKIYKNNFNIGFAGNLQRTSEKAIGRFLIMLSSDDLMNNGALYHYYKLIEKYKNENEQLVLHSAFDVINHDNELREVHYRFPVSKKGQYLHEDYFHKELSTDLLKSNIENFQTNDYVLCDGGTVFREGLFDTRSPAGFLTTCYSRALWQKVEGYDTTFTYMPDYVFLLKILALQPTVIYCRPRLFSYRVHSNNQNAKQRSQMSIRKYLDEYLLTIQFPEELLLLNDINRKSLIEFTIQNKWLYWSIRNFKFISWQEGFRLWAFGYATYPWIIFKKYKNLEVFLWAILSPLTRMLYLIYLKIKKRSTKQMTN
jgi:glycosyltransferase involved in cell wall biosynthesis